MNDSMQPKSYRSPVEVTFTFPETLQQETGYTSITVRELTGSAESRAISRAGTDGGVLMQELVKESLCGAVKMDSGPVAISTADSSIDQIMAEIGPKGRGLALQAYSFVNQPNKDQAASFLQSASATVR